MGTQNSRSKSETYGIGTFAKIYGSVPCDSPRFSSSRTLVQKSESVDSYRGRPIYLTVNEKRIRKYNSFDRWLWEWHGNDCWELCNSDGVAYYECEPHQRLDPSKDYGRALTAKLTGDVPPLAPDMLDEIGQYYRDFVIRDMYVKANSPRFNVAKFTAELGETLISIRELFVGAVRTLFKADEAWKYVKHFSLNSEELWLWYRYALLPAMLDAEDILKALKPPEPINRIQDGLMHEEDLSGYFECGKYFNTTPSKWSYTGKLKVRCGGALDILSINDPSPWGTSAWDVVLGAAEVIPFGFVFNWFLNFEDWLASLRDADVTYTQSYATYAVDVNVEFNPENGVMHGANHSCHAFRQRRAIDVEPPRLPLLDKNWASLLRTVDAITLTVGILKGILKKRRK